MDHGPGQEDSLTEPILAITERKSGVLAVHLSRGEAHFSLPPLSTRTKPAITATQPTHLGTIPAPRRVIPPATPRKTISGKLARLPNRIGRSIEAGQFHQG